MNNATILVVDDEPQLRRAMKATLSDLAAQQFQALLVERAEAGGVSHAWIPTFLMSWPLLEPEPKTSINSLTVIPPSIRATGAE